MNVELVSDIRDHLSEASVKVSSRSNIRNPVKTPPVLQVSSWSHGGHLGSWWTWSWYQMMGIILKKHLWKFHQDPTSVTLSKQLESFIIMCWIHTHTLTDIVLIFILMIVKVNEKFFFMKTNEVSKDSMSKKQILRCYCWTLNKVTTGYLAKCNMILPMESWT